jgi:hypothetical protein
VLVSETLLSLRVRWCWSLILSLLRDDDDEEDDDGLSP